MKTKVTFLGVLTMLAVLGSCQKDDDPVTPDPTPQNATSFASMDAVEYPIKNAYAFDLGKYSTSDTENFVLEFTNATNDGIFYSPNTTTIIAFDLNSKSADKISAGTYVLNASDDYPEFTFTESYAHFNLEYKASDKSFFGGDRFDDDTEGSLTISYSGDTTNISYKVKFNGGKVLEGKYKGKIQYYSLID